MPRPVPGNPRHRLPSVITDKAAFAHQTGVFVLEAILAHPALQAINHFTGYDTGSRPFYTHAGLPANIPPHPVRAINSQE